VNGVDNAQGVAPVFGDRLWCLFFLPSQAADVLPRLFAVSTSQSQRPRGKPLVTLRDAAAYITALPKKEADTAEWQAAIEALMLVAESGGPTMLPRIGIMRALKSR
jgi:hypothetical protein